MASNLPADHYAILFLLSLYCAGRTYPGAQPTVHTFFFIDSNVPIFDCNCIFTTGLHTLHAFDTLAIGVYRDRFHRMDAKILDLRHGTTIWASRYSQFHRVMW